MQISAFFLPPLALSLLLAAGCASPQGSAISLAGSAPTSATGAVDEVKTVEMPTPANEADTTLGNKVPDYCEQTVCLLGNISKQGFFPLKKDGTLPLCMAMAMAGGAHHFGDGWNKFHIIRSISPLRGEFIVVDFQKILDGEAMDFQLRAGDVVYIANSRFRNWDEVLAAISPSLGLIGGRMTPFVRRQLGVK